MKRLSQNCSMTKCTKTGIKIKNTDNDYRIDPFANINPFSEPLPETKNKYSNKNSYEDIDLNINNYSREEIYKLFGFDCSHIITENHMKEARKIVLKTHPDKSNLDDKYFVFFSKAFDKIKTIYEFQNKLNSKKTIDTSEYFDKNNVGVLDKMFENKPELGKGANFNNWFNKEFEKHRLNDPNESGYGDWLKSDEDISFTSQNVSKDTMAREIEKRKKQIQSIIPYSGVGYSFEGSSIGGSSLMEYDKNYSQGSLFGDSFTDLKQAYVESVIPVTEDDYNNIPKYKSIDDYRRHRDSTNVRPLSKEESVRQLYSKELQDNNESAALAFYYAQQSEKVREKNEQFWSSLKQITNK